MGTHVESLESAARSALSRLDADDRDVWIRAGLAIKAEFGDAGYGMWADWASRSGKWNERDGRYTWRNMRPRSIGIGSLFHAARAAGWDGRAPRRRDPFELRKWRAADPPERVDETAERAKLAAARAMRIIREGVVAPEHPYLAAKGFPETPWLQHEERLVVPVRRWPAYRSAKAVTSIQTIAPDGGKRFLRGGRVDRGVFALGKPMHGHPILMCEGLATGLTVRAALKEMSLQYPVAVCFSASGLTRIARRERRAIVVGDCDDSGAGQRAARASGRPHWIPPEPGDANDLHQSAGIEAVIAGIRPLITAWWRR